MRIGSNLSSVSMTVLNNLLKLNNSMALITQQLATGSLLNRGSDNPSALIAADQIRAELSAIEAAGSNAASAHNMINVADAGMSQVGDLLRTIRADVVAASGDTLSDAEKQALQMEIDASIQSLNAIGANTSYNGQKLLTGETLTFNFSPNPDETVTLTMPDVNAAALGGTAGLLSDLASGGSANVINGDLSKAGKIIQAVETEIAQERGQLGAFDKYIVDSASATLDAMQINLNSALSQIADTDMAQSMSLLVRNEILTKATLQALVTANRSQELVLQLFGNNKDKD